MDHLDFDLEYILAGQDDLWTKIEKIKLVFHNTYVGTVTRVIDGDTFECLVNLGFGVQQVIRIRLMGIDTPEITGKDKERGLFVKQYVEEKILNKQVTLVGGDSDKYGRRLANIYVDGKDLATHLNQNGLYKYVFFQCVCEI